jgi:pyruvate,water dikinase
MLGAVPFTRTYIKNWEKMMGIDSSDESNKKNFPSIFNILSPSLNLIKIWVTLDTRLLHLENQITKNVFIPFWKEENRKNIKTISELLNYFEYFKIEIFKEWELTIINDIYAFIFSGLTRHFLLRWHGIEGGSLFNKLLAGVKTMDSVLPLDSLKDLGSHYKDYGEDAQFNVKFKNHLSNYGDRGIAELKLESLTPRENPEILLTLIKEYAQTKNIDKFKENYFNEKKSGLEAEIRIYELLKNNFLKRKILNYLIINTKKTISYREKFRLHRARAYGILRRLVLDIGECLVTENKINEVRDIFYITLDEVQTKNLNLRKIIEHRKNEEKEFLLENVSGRYLVDGNNFSSLINEFDQNKKVHMAKGEPCSSGVIKAIGLVVKTTQELESNPEFIRGKILIAPMTDPGWVFYMTLAAGLIVEKGSILSHTAIIGRELGIPTIVGVKNATEIFKSGELILLNANDGTVEKILNEKE